MSNQYEHVTPPLVTSVCKRLLETLPSHGYDDTVVWEALDAYTRFAFAEKATDILVLVIPALVENGWIPPIEIDMEEYNEGNA